jgi:hypothetical protein
MACVEYITTLAELAIGSTTLEILFVHYRLTCVNPSDTMNKIHNTILGLQGLFLLPSGELQEKFVRKKS